MSLQNEQFLIDFSSELFASPFRAAAGEIFILTDCVCSLLRCCATTVSGPQTVFCLMYPGNLRAANPQ